MVKVALGSLSLSMGMAILVWCGYCLFAPNKYFHWRLMDIPRLAVPLALVWVGWRWIRADAAKGKRYASEIIISLKLSGSDFGTEPERQTVLGLEHRLEHRIQAEDLGEVDGEEFGDGECSIFVRTNAAAKVEAIIRDFFRDQAPSLSYSLTRAALPDAAN